MTYRKSTGVLSAAVTICGGKLGDPYRTIIRHRVTSVKASDGSIAIGDGNQERIESIAIEIMDG